MRYSTNQGTNQIYEDKNYSNKSKNLFIYFGKCLVSEDAPLFPFQKPKKYFFFK